MDLTSGIEETLELESSVVETLALGSSIIGGLRHAVFNGSNAYVNIADDDLLTFSDGSNDSPFSISLWIKADSFINQPICLKGPREGISSEWILKTDGGSILYFQLTDTSQMPGKQIFIGRQVWNSGVGISGYAGSLINIICTYKGTGGMSHIIIRINGTIKDDDNSSANQSDYSAMQNTSNDFNIGHDDYNSQYINARIYDLRIYDKELSLSEINNIVAGNPLETNLLAHYKLQNDVRDYGPNGLDGINNNVTFPTTEALALVSGIETELSLESSLL